MTRLMEIGPEIWIAEGPVVDFYSFPYSTRMVLVRLPDGGLWVWSPIALDENMQAEVAALGTPRHLISPNRLHHLFLKDWASVWPEARLWALPSVKKKLAHVGITDWLGDTPPPDWSGVIDQTVFRGNPLIEEAVFFHKASKTAIFTDLTENFSDRFLRSEWKGWKYAIAKLWRITEPFGKAPLEVRLTWFGKAKGRASLDTVKAWEPQQVVMAHGEWVRSGGADYIARSFDWLG